MKHTKQELIEKATLLYKEVYKFAVSRTKDQEAAKDIAQTVMEIVVLKIDTLKNSDSLKPWIMQITSNEIKGYFRKLKQLRDNTIVNDRNEDETIFDEIKDAETDILQGILERESQKNIIKALLRLEEKYQTILRLHVIYELPFNKIAEKLKINSNTVKTRYFRGVKLLHLEFMELERGGRQREKN